MSGRASHRKVCNGERGSITPGLDGSSLFGTRMDHYVTVSLVCPYVFDPLRLPSHNLATLLTVRANGFFVLVTQGAVCGLSEDACLR